MADGIHPGSRRPVVLLVDDERNFLVALKLNLERDFEVETANSSEEAEIMMGSGSYDVVVCDHLMPGELGLEFLSRMKDVFPQTRRILITGYLNPELLSRSVSLAGLSACLIKPIKAEAIAAAVKGALAQGPQN